MAKQRRTFECPHCRRENLGSVGLDVTRTLTQADVVVRHRTCPNGHKVVTRETQGISWADVVVNRRARGHTAFDEKRLLADLQEAFHRVLEPAQIRVLADEVQRELERSLTAVGSNWTLDDTAILETVERHLRLFRPQTARMLYVLSFRARTDYNSPGKDFGFETATELMAWMIRNEIAQSRVGHAVVPGASAGRAEVWWPSGSYPVPQTIHRAPGPTRESRPREPSEFEIRVLRRSIYQALHGRSLLSCWQSRADRERAETPYRRLKPIPRRRQAVTDLLTERVLEDLAGQPTVTTWQVAATILRALRQLDDIAYLNYAVRSKNLHNQSSFNAEVWSLIVSPSPRLLFGLVRKNAADREQPVDPEAAPRRAGREGQPASMAPVPAPLGLFEDQLDRLSAERRRDVTLALQAIGRDPAAGILGLRRVLADLVRPAGQGLSETEPLQAVSKEGLYVQNMEELLERPPSGVGLGDDHWSSVVGDLLVLIERVSDRLHAPASQGPR